MSPEVQFASAVAEFSEACWLQIQNETLKHIAYRANYRGTYKTENNLSIRHNIVRYAGESFCLLLKAEKLL